MAVGLTVEGPAIRIMPVGIRRVHREPLTLQLIMHTAALRDVRIHRDSSYLILQSDSWLQREPRSSLVVASAGAVWCRRHQSDQRIRWVRVSTTLVTMPAPVLRGRVAG